MIKCRKILDREEEYLKLNAVLDEERQGLLQQLGNVMKFHEQATEDPLGTGSTSAKLKSPATIDQDINGDSNDSWSLKMLTVNNAMKASLSATNASRVKGDKLEKQNTLPTSMTGGSVPQASKLTRHKSEMHFRERFEGTLVPDSVKNMGQDGVLRFLKAKVQILSEQLAAVQKDEKKLMEKVKELQGDRERVSEDRDKWIQQANIAKNVLMKHEHHASNIVMQLQGTQAENGHLKKELEKLKKELKLVAQNSGSNEVRLNRSLEEVERLKNSLRQMKQEEKEVRESARKKTEELNIALKKIEKQKVELLHAFKKQLVVIDNLKKQKDLAEAEQLLKSIEEDFMEFLDWNPNKSH